MQQLTEKNVHRAAIVRSKVNPEWGELPILYRGERHGFRHYSHVVGAEESKIIVPGKDLQNWEVVVFKYEVNLEEFWDRAVTAKNWTSWDPKVTGQNLLVEFETRLTEDLSKIPDVQKERYITNFKTHFSNILSKESRCTASAITGPANYNVRRHQKSCNAENAAYNAFNEWREKALNSIAKKIEADKPEDQKLQEEWEYLKNSYQSMLDFCEREYGNGSHHGITNFYSKLEVRAREGKVWLIEQAFEYITKLNEGRKKPIVTSRHKFWKLKDLAIQSKQKKEEQKQRKNSIIEFDGGKVVQNWAIDRLQIFFDEIPSKEVRALLKKKYCFHFSAKEGKAWQRKNTNNAISAYSEFITIYKAEKDKEKLIQTLKQIVENSRDKNVPVIADTIHFTDSRGNYYPEAIIHGVSDSPHNEVSLCPGIVNIEMWDWKTHRYRLYGYKNESLSHDLHKFKFVGTEPRTFKFKGQIQYVEFTAIVNVWEYK